MEKRFIIAFPKKQLGRFIIALPTLIWTHHDPSPSYLVSVGDFSSTSPLHPHDSTLTSIIPLFPRPASINSTALHFDTFDTSLRALLTGAMSVWDSPGSRSTMTGGCQTSWVICLVPNLPLGLSWANLGSSWAHLGSSWAPLGLLLCSSWLLLGSSWVAN